MSGKFMACPFCGKPQAIIDTLNYHGEKPVEFRVQCQACGVTTRWCDTEEQAGEAWNSRTAANDPHERTKKAERLKTCSECLKKQSEKLLAEAERQT
jgi:Lar family restriction alleviation protein